METTDLNTMNQINNINAQNFAQDINEPKIPVSRRSRIPRRSMRRRRPDRMYRNTDSSFSQIQNRMSRPADYELTASKIYDTIRQNEDYDAKIAAYMKARNLTFNSKKEPFSEALDSIYVPALSTISSYALSHLTAYFTPSSSVGQVIQGVSNLTS